MSKRPRKTSKPLAFSADGQGSAPSGCLFVVATPIGNLGDLSPRARQVLSQVSLIACEAQTATRRLLSALEIPSPRLVSYREENSAKIVPEILAHLQAGESAALVSEAGTPAVSDPGWELVRACHNEGIAVQAVAGPSSLAAALSVAGVPCRQVLFLSFPPHQGKARRDYLQRHLSGSETAVLFESPHRLKETLEDLRAFLGDEQEIVLLRELTKLYEEVRTGTLAEICLKVKDTPPRGEFVLVIPERLPAHQEQRQESKLRARISFLQEAGLSNRHILEYLTQLEGQARNLVYSILMDSAEIPQSV